MALEEHCQRASTSPCRQGRDGQMCKANGFDVFAGLDVLYRPGIQAVLRTCCDGGVFGGPVHVRTFDRCIVTLVYHVIGVAESGGFVNEFNADID